MQYDRDMKSVHADVFMRIRKVLLSFPQIEEIKNAKQTSYRDEYGVVVMMRGREKGLVVSFGKGAKLLEKFPMLQGSGKVVRHLLVRSLEDLDEDLLRAMIEESLVLNMEAYEIRYLKAAWV